MNDNAKFLDDLEQRLKDPGFRSRRQEGLSDSEVGKLIALARKGLVFDATYMLAKHIAEKAYLIFERAERYEKALRAISDTRTNGKDDWPLRHIAYEALEEKSLARELGRLERENPIDVGAIIAL